MSSILASWKSFQNWWNIKAYTSISLSESLKLIMRMYILYFSTNNKYDTLMQTCFIMSTKNISINLLPKLSKAASLISAAFPFILFLLLLFVLLFLLLHFLGIFSKSVNVLKQLTKFVILLFRARSTDQRKNSEIDCAL